MNTIQRGILGFAAAALTVAAPLGAQTIAITGGKVYPISGPAIEHGTVLIRDGKITAVGANVPVPAGATRVDATGQLVTPGFINAAGQIGLVEIGSVAGTREGSLSGDDVSAAFNVLEGVNPASQLIPVTRVEGITTVVAGPSGGLIAGQAVALDLLGDRIEDLAVKSPVAMVAALDEAAKEAGGGSRAGMMERMRRLFADALDYEKRTADYRKNGMQELSAPVADLEALLPVLHGKLPIMIAANRRSDIENALRLAKEYKLKLILTGAAEGWEVADEIKAAGVPVLLDPLVDIPSYDALSPRLDNAALLRKAGVTVAIASFDSHNTRDVRQSAGNAVANGMAWDEALRAVTLDAARELEIEKSYGSLEPGKVANVVVWTGDPFEFSSYPSAVFIRGKLVPKDSRQHELFERYKNLPPTY